LNTANAVYECDVSIAFRFQWLCFLWVLECKRNRMHPYKTAVVPEF